MDAFKLGCQIDFDMWIYLAVRNKE